MIVTLSNVGILRWARFSPAPLTVVCGDNISGKTFASYAWFGFLDFFINKFRLPIPSNLVPDFLNTGRLSLHVDSSLDELNNILTQAASEYSSVMHEVFAANRDDFKTASFLIELEEGDIDFVETFSSSFSSASREIIQISRKGANDNLHFSWVGTGDTDKNSPAFKSIVAVLIADVLKNVLFSKIFPLPFVTSAERTGAAIFRKDIVTFNFIDDESPAKEIFKLNNARYPLPIIKNVAFINKLDFVSNRQGELAESHPEILEEFAKIAGGRYDVDKATDLVVFIPDGSSKKYKMAQSASSVRALMDLYFYIKHVAAPGKLLIIDEPELNLHPSRQIAMGRLICMLVKYGLKVMVTTHSDYILREINNLLLLNSKLGKKAVDIILDKYQINKDCLIPASDVALYTAKVALAMVPGYKRRIKVNTLINSDFNPDYGFIDNVFSETLHTVALLQQDITLADYESQ